MTNQKIVFFTKNHKAPSFRYRLLPVIELLQSLGHKCHIEKIDGCWYGFRVWSRRALISSADVVVLHKLMLPTLESFLLCSLNPNTLYDVDDAIYIKQPKHVGQERNQSIARIRKFKAITRLVKLVVVGNEFLRSQVAKQARSTIVLPTAVDVKAYPEQGQKDDQFIDVVWVGLPANLRYLEMLKPVFESISRKNPRFRLKVISSEFPSWDDVNIKTVPWSIETEKEEISRSHIGIMPLDSSEYSRGKCAFKLLQYMSAELPCVASPVGVNCEVIDEQVGFLAHTINEWEKSLTRLIEDEELRLSMGKKGKEKVLTLYDQDVIMNKLTDFILNLPAEK